MYKVKNYLNAWQNLAWMGDTNEYDGIIVKNTANTDIGTIDTEWKNVHGRQNLLLLVWKRRLKIKDKRVLTLNENGLEKWIEQMYF